MNVFMHIHIPVRRCKSGIQVLHMLLQLLHTLQKRCHALIKRPIPKQPPKTHVRGAKQVKNRLVIVAFDNAREAPHRY